MRCFLLLLVVIAAAFAQRTVNLGFIDSVSQGEIRQIMSNPNRVRFIISCLLAKPVPDQCNSEPLFKPLENSVAAFSSDKQICRGCSGDQRRKVGLILSLLQQNYPAEYNRVATAFNLA